MLPRPSVRACPCVKAEMARVCVDRAGALTCHDNTMTVDIVRNVQQEAREQLNRNADYVRAFASGPGVAFWTQMESLARGLRETQGLA